MSEATDNTRDRPERLNEIGRESRERILDAAERLFTQHGVDNTTYAAIQRAAGISRGSIPWHFENKAGLLQAIVDRALIMSTADPDTDASLDELLERARATMHTPQAAFLSALLSEATRPDSPHHERYVEWHEASRRLVANAVAADDAATPPEGTDAGTIAIVVFGAIIGVHLQWRLAPELVDLDESVDALGRLLHAALYTD
jgi:TetR/AcrR family acrAB operon transcriptional repressor